jgi:hypothetical protein
MLLHRDSRSKPVAERATGLEKCPRGTSARQKIAARRLATKRLIDRRFSR